MKLIQMAMLRSYNLLDHLPIFALALFTAALIQACDVSPQGEDEESGPEPIPLSQVDTTNTIHDSFAEVAEQIPGFGGLFFDEEGNPNVYLLEPDPSRVDQVESTLRGVFGDDVLERGDSPHRPVEDPQTELLEGNFRMDNLLTWYDRIPQVFTVDEVVLTDLNERENRLTVGVTDLDVSERIDSILTNLEIPREGVSIVKAEPPRPKRHDLRSRFRPIRGGVEIVVPPNLSGVCTLGPSGRLDESISSGTVEGFLTAAHCTAAERSVDEASSYNNGGDQIGKETTDPPVENYFTTNPPIGFRYSDAAFITSSTNVAVTGEIARPETRSTQSNITLGIDHSNPTFEITDYEGYPSWLQGLFVNKVGRTTGWTTGIVNRTCFNTQDTEGDYYACQYEASYCADDGDSGSPVFSWLGGNEVTVFGVHWGTTTDCSGNNVGDSVFSPLGGAVRDMRGRLP